MTEQLSMRRRLELSLIASLLLVATIIGVAGSVMFGQALREFALGQLQQDAQGVLAAVRRGPAGLVIDQTRLAPAYRTPLSGRYFVLTTERERWRSRSLWDSELASPVRPGPVAGLVDGPAGQRLLVMRVDYLRHGETLAIVVATDVAPLTAEFRRIGLALAALLTASLILLAWILRQAMRRALHPLEVARSALRELQEGRRDVLDEAVPMELYPLVSEVNHLLRQTRQTLSRARRALGNLGHSLKTPLAVLISIAERMDPAFRSQVEPQLLRMRQRIGRELSRASAAGDPLIGARFEPAEDVPSLLETLRRAHARDPRTVLAFPQETIPLEREDMLELLGNLLDNAFKWCVERIELRITTEPGGVSIVVEDDGPGIPEMEQTKVLNHGVRLDERIEGHGLGLGIVSDIVDSYSGTLEIGNVADGGLRVYIWLPAAQAPVAGLTTT